MQRTGFEAGESAVLRPCEDLPKRRYTVTFLGVDQHGNPGAATIATASRKKKIVIVALRLRSPTLKSAQQVRRASSQIEARDSGDV